MCVIIIRWYLKQRKCIRSLRERGKKERENILAQFLVFRNFKIGLKERKEPPKGKERKTEWEEHSIWEGKCGCREVMGDCPRREVNLVSITAKPNDTETQCQSYLNESINFCKIPLKT